MTPKVVVVGAGVAGLSCACALLDDAEAHGLPVDVAVLDAGATAGGHACTDEVDGFVIERGPNGFLSREPQTLERVEALGLTPRLVEARHRARRRFILRDGRLRQVPDGPRTLLSSRALSWRGTLRLLAEPWASGPPAHEETVYEFARRRIGAEAADVLVDTAVSGISAGDSRRLSVAAQFPMMVDMEREHGGLVRAMFARRSRGGGPSRLLSFDRGLGVFTRAMADRLSSRLETGCTVSAITPGQDGWTVHLTDGTRRRVDHVVLATAARAAAPLVHAVDAPLAAVLAGIPYSGLAVVALGVRTSDLTRRLDGYGYLVPRSEAMVSLGVLWESSIFPGRAPEGHALLRVFLGGARRPDVAAWDASTLVETACREVAPVLGLRAEPGVSRVFRWPEAIAQYTLGHLQRRAEITARLGRHPGLHLCGTSYDGVSFNHAVASGHRAARVVSDALADRQAPAGAALP